MTDLLYARAQMGASLGFHILFAVVGMAMPLLGVLAEWFYLRTGDVVYNDLARRWAKGTAILFAVGAVSGTVLSFELGLLWPEFMKHAGPIIGMPFSLEGFAFFLEAIFLGLYLYGWDKLSPRKHIAAGVVVALSGLASGIFVVAVNGWMNTPTGFTVIDGVYTDIDPWKAFWNPAFTTEALHMSLAAYTSVAFAVLGIHAWRLLKDPGSAFHRAAVRLAFGLALVSTPLQILSGDIATRAVHTHQPTKLAALEAHFHTGSNAPLTIGGWPDERTGVVHGGLELPGALSLLLTGSTGGEIAGLDAYPRADWPPVAIVHLAFDVMVGAGFTMLAVVGAGLLSWLLRRPPWTQRWFLRAAALAGPLGLIALEAGWVVTEVGRQPWIIRGYMRTADAVTPMPGLVVPFTAFMVLYVFLGVVVLVLLKAHVFSVPVSVLSRSEPPE